MPATTQSERDVRESSIAAADAPVGSPGPPWYALYTRSHCEHLVSEQLHAKCFELFCPTLEVWSRRGALRHRISVPMFLGYLFLHHALDKVSFLEVRKVRGLVRILVQIKAPKGLFVLSVELLQRSVAVEVDCTAVVAA